MSVPEGALVSVCVLLRDRDVLHARRVAGQELEKLGARSVKKTRFVTAVSEIGRNAVMHPPCVTVVCRDKGPGIADVDAALCDGFSTAGSMGRGLGGARRLCDQMEIETTVGKGTCVTMVARL